MEPGGPLVTNDPLVCSFNRRFFTKSTQFDPLPGWAKWEPSGPLVTNDTLACSFKRRFNKKSTKFEPLRGWAKWEPSGPLVTNDPLACGFNRTFNKKSRSVGGYRGLAIPLGSRWFMCGVSLRTVCVSSGSWQILASTWQDVWCRAKQ